ncbi:MAG: ANTAR domain-containing response regulator [Chthonomonadales bacterium]
MFTGRIIIADDDPVIRMDLRAMLEELGHQVVAAAENGEAAWKLAQTLKPDLVILDVMMPGMDGLQAAARISSERLAPVLLLTAYSEAPMVEQATRAGVLAYLVKPFRKQELQPAVEIALARFRELSALEGQIDALQEQIETRRAVGRAKAILMQRFGVSDREAMRRLQAQSLSLNRSLKQIAEAIILTEEISPTNN